MKKIITAIDGLKYSESTTRYVTQLAMEAGAHLVGVFLEDFTYHGYKIYDLVGDEGVSETKRHNLEEIDVEARQRAVTDFEAACREKGLNYSVHHDRNIAIQELIHESIYADLLIIGSNETLTHYAEDRPTRFIRDLLERVQCPVMVVPASYKPLDKLVLLYDGEPSSVYAIKEFSYLFPAIHRFETEVLTINNPKHTLHVPGNRLMKEFMRRHFPAAFYTVFKGDPETEIINYLEQLEGRNPVIVLGAYNRGMVSRWFRPSMADILMKEIDAPLFIAHQ
jgi:hypothetical protein